MSIVRTRTFSLPPPTPLLLLLLPAVPLLCCHPPGWQDSKPLQTWAGEESRTGWLGINRLRGGDLEEITTDDVNHEYFRMKFSKKDQRTRKTLEKKLSRREHVFHDDDAAKYDCDECLNAAFVLNGEEGMTVLHAADVLVEDAGQAVILVRSFRAGGRKKEAERLEREEADRKREQKRAFFLKQMQVTNKADLHKLLWKVLASCSLSPCSKLTSAFPLPPPRRTLDQAVEEGEEVLVRQAVQAGADVNTRYSTVKHKQTLHSSHSPAAATRSRETGRTST
eukprot:753130-Hanusia_phi.AAC.2